VVVLVTGGLSGFWLFRYQQQRATAAAQALASSQRMGEVRLATNQYVDELQERIVAIAAGDLPSGGVPKLTSAELLNDFVRTLSPDSLRPATADPVASGLESLGKLGNEIVSRTTAAPTEERQKQPANKKKAEQAETEQAQQTLVALSKQLVQVHGSINTGLVALEKDILANATALLTLADKNLLYLYLSLGAGLGLAILLTVISMVSLHRNVSAPLEKMTYKLSDRKALPEVPGPLGQISWYVNQVQKENRKIEEAVSRLAKGETEVTFTTTDFAESVAIELTSLQRLVINEKERATQLENSSKKIEAESKKAQTEHNKEIEKLQKSEAASRERLTKLEDESKQKATELERASTELKVKQSEAERLSASLTALQTQMNAGGRELDKIRTQLSDAKAQVEKVHAEYGSVRAKMSAVESSLAIAELDAEGRLVYTDSFFARLSGYSAEELKGLEMVQLAGGLQDRAFYDSIWQTVAKGQTWYGVFQNKSKTGEPFWLATAITPIQSPPQSNGNGHAQNGNGEAKYLLAGYEVSAMKNQEQELRDSLATITAEIETYRKKVGELQGAQQTIVRDYKAEQAHEHRLVQQQKALTTLTRNHDLKQGNVREALRSITETTAYALDEGRVGLWLFTENGTRLRCLDVYDRQRMAHRDSIELKRESFPDFFNAVEGDQIVALEDARTDERTRYLYPAYLQPNAISCLMSVPIHLGGDVVGAIITEHIGEPRKFELDEQNFLMSVADIVSLALEQGNRLVMEEELRHTLEQSQALEEELRQNAEEIESTNEEMKKTQVELRGQISAMNNSAIVAESNTDGTITYVNEEFSKVYGMERDRIMGRKHSLINSGFHPPLFFQHMWATIQSGRVWKGEVKNRATDGTDIWVLLTISPVIGIDGKPYKFIGVSFNITAQKLQEEQIKQALDVALQQEEMLRQNAEELEYANEEMHRTQIELAGQINALNNSSMVYETDMDGVITYVNDELLEIGNYTREDLIGKRYTVLKSGRQPDALYQEQWRTVLNGRIWRGELEKKTKDGRYFWVVVTNTPVMDDAGEPIKSINVLFDVTVQKQQEFRLKKQQSSLLELTSHPSIKEGDQNEGFGSITKIGMETLGVSRASIWLYDDTGGSVTCQAVFELNGTSMYETGTKLDRELYPIYFRTLERDRVIAANDAMNDPRTRELAATLFMSQGTSAVLDTAIRQGARTVGVISFEHRGAQRTWMLDEQSFATSLADTVGLVLEQKERRVADKLKMAYSQLEEANQEVIRQKNAIEEQATHLRESIKYAKRIQQNILPNKDYISAHIPNHFIVYKPRDVVGGDFYWFSAIENKKVMIVADGTGHGVPGAFLTLIGYLLLNQIVSQQKITKPSEILYHLHIGVRSALKQDEEGSESRDGMDVAVCTFDTATYEAQFAGANLPFNYYQDWDLHTIKPNKYAIGGEQMEEERTFENHTVQLKPGDAVYLYTDGFVDQMGGPDEKRFSTRRFRDLVLRTQHESMATQRALLNIEWKEWKDDREQLDDVTVYGMKV